MKRVAPSVRHRPWTGPGVTCRPAPYAHKLRLHRLFSSNKHKPKWGLDPKYALYLPFGRLDALNDACSFGVLDQPQWQYNELRKSYRALTDEHATPRDLYVVDTICRLLQNSGSTGSDADTEQKTSKRRRGKAAASNLADTVGKAAESLSAISAGPSGTISSPGAREHKELEDRGTSASIRAFLEASQPVFTTLLGRGLPHVHRPADTDAADGGLDKVMFHEKLLSAWKEDAAAAVKAGSAHPGLEVQPLRARIVDAYSVWDGTGIGAPTRTGSSQSPGNPDTEDFHEEDATHIISSEAGHSIAMRRAEEDMPWPLRLAAGYFHYFKLLPPRRIVTQVTTAYECRERDVLPASAAAATDGTAAAPSGAGDVPASSPPLQEPVTHGSKPGTAAWKNTVHTVTFEATAGFAYSAVGGLRGTIGNFIRFFDPMHLVRPTAGWRVVDVDGHFGRHLGPSASATFVPWFEEARSLAINQGTLYEQVMLEGLRVQAEPASYMTKIARLQAESLVELRSILASTPAGRGALLSVAVEKDDPRIADGSLLGGATEDGSASTVGIGMHGRAVTNASATMAHKHALLQLQGLHLRVDGLLALQIAGLSKSADILQGMYDDLHAPGGGVAPWVSRLRKDAEFESQLAKMTEKERLEYFTGKGTHVDIAAAKSLRDRTRVPVAPGGTSGSSEDASSASSTAAAAAADAQAQDDQAQEEEDAWWLAFHAPVTLTEGPWPVRPDSAFNTCVGQLDHGLTLHTLSTLSQGEMMSRLLSVARQRIASLGGMTAVQLLDSKTCSLMASAASLEVVHALCEHLSRYVTPAVVLQARADGADTEEKAKQVAERLQAHVAELQGACAAAGRSVMGLTMRSEWAELKGTNHPQEDEDEDEEEDGGHSKTSVKKEEMDLSDLKPSYTTVSEALEHATETAAEDDKSDDPAVIRKTIGRKVLAVHVAAKAVLLELKYLRVLDVRRDAEGTPVEPKKKA